MLFHCNSSASLLGRLFKNHKGVALTDFKSGIKTVIAAALSRFGSWSFRKQKTAQNFTFPGATFP
jgi:hypothetical protein